MIHRGSSDQITGPGAVPVLDLAAELAVQTACLRAAEAGLLRSAHDCADGGLAIALAECCFSSLNREVYGADIDITGDYDVVTRLFSESPSRIIISFDESALGDIEEIVAAAGCPMTLLGNVGADRLRIESDGDEVIQLDVSEMESAWRSSLKNKLQAEVRALERNSRAQSKIRARCVFSSSVDIQNRQRPQRGALYHSTGNNSPLSRAKGLHQPARQHKKVRGHGCRQIGRRWEFCFVWSHADVLQAFAIVHDNVRHR